MPDLIRHPLPRAPWIAGQARNDKPSFECRVSPSLPDVTEPLLSRSPCCHAGPDPASIATRTNGLRINSAMTGSAVTPLRALKHPRQVLRRPPDAVHWIGDGGGACAVLGRHRTVAHRTAPHRLLQDVGRLFQSCYGVPNHAAPVPGAPAVPVAAAPAPHAPDRPCPDAGCRQPC